MRALASFVLPLLLVCVAAYLLVLAFVYAFQRSLIYYPGSARPRLEGLGLAAMRPVTLVTEDGLELLAWWAPPSSAAAPVVLYLHGNAGSLAHRADKVRPFLTRGFGVLLPAWRGYSGNPGQPTEQGLYRDARAARQFLDENGIAPARRALYGESLGGAVAVQLASESRFAALVLEASFSSMTDAAMAHYPFFPIPWLLNDRYESAAKMKDVSAPLLLLHGERDGVVPVALGRRLFEAAGEPRQAKFYPRAGHNDLHEFGALDAAAGFIARYAGQKAPVP